jgi:hypothetical protein
VERVRVAQYLQRRVLSCCRDENGRREESEKSSIDYMPQNNGWLVTMTGLFHSFGLVCNLRCIRIKIFECVSRCG